MLRYIFVCVFCVYYCVLSYVLYYCDVIMWMVGSGVSGKINSRTAQLCVLYAVQFLEQFSKFLDWILTH